MSPKISELTADDSIGGGEVVPCTDSTTSKKITINQIKDYTIDQIEGTSAATDVDGEDGVFILKDGVLRPVDIDKVAQHAIDTIWGKGAEASPDSLDKLPLKDGDTEKTITLGALHSYVEAEIEAALLNLSTLADGSGALADADHMLVTQGTPGTGRRVTLANINAQIYSSLKDHVNSLGATTPADGDLFYVVSGGAGKKVTLADIVAHFDTSVSTLINDSDEISEAIVDAGTFLVDNGANGTQKKATFAKLKTWIEGLGIAWDGNIADIDMDASTANEISGALADGDLIVVDQGGEGQNRTSLVSRIWDYILDKIGSETDVSSWASVLDEDGLVTASDTKLATQQSIKAYVDDQAAWDGTLTDIKVAGGDDIDRALDNDDLLVVNAGGAAGANKRSALSRFWTYIQGKINALPAKADPVLTDTVFLQDVSDGNALKGATLQNLVKGLPPFAGATSILDGENGVVPAPAAGDGEANKFLKADGSWQVPSGYTGNWDGDIATMNIVGGTGIGADLADGDLIVVNDGAGALVKTSAVTRIWTYIQGKINAVATKADPVNDDFFIIEDSDGSALKRVYVADILKIGGEDKAVSTHSLAMTDCDKHIRLSHAEGVDLTVPPNGTVAFKIGTQISFVQAGDGQVTFVEGGGVTINSAESKKTRKQFSSAVLVKVDTDVWDLMGDLAEAE